jgi:AraC-like DNA-binding protein
LLFAGPVRFNATQAGLSFHPQYLALPIKRDEADLRQMLQRALPLTVLQYRRDRLLVQRVRHFFRSELPASPTAEAVAAALNLSPRTLYRQLRAEKASLQQLKDEVRRDRAIELLTRTRQPIKHLAQSVGFRSEKSFIRAFRLWTQQSPTVFRETRRVLEGAS